MEILHLVQTYPQGGTGIRMQNLLSRTPFNVRIIAGDEGLGRITLPHYEESGGIRINRIDIPSGKFRYLPTMLLPRKIANYADSLNLDYSLVHYHGAIPWGQAAYLISRRHHIPLVCESHAIMGDYRGKGLIERLKWAYIGFIERRLMNIADRVIVLTEAQRRYYID